MNNLKEYIIKDSIHKDTMIKMVRDNYKTKTIRINKIQYTRLRLIYKL
jgi:hypothetical protein